MAPIRRKEKKAIASFILLTELLELDKESLESLGKALDSAKTAGGMFSPGILYYIFEILYTPRFDII